MVKYTSPNITISILLKHPGLMYTGYMQTDEKPLQPERLETIRQLLLEEGTVRVSELSEVCGVSENTIRRDLMELEDGGFCYRTKGGAGLLKRGQGGVAFTQRLERNRDSKRAIARRAAGEVHSGETIILDSGTTALELALELKSRSHITVITPSLEAANILSGLPDITLILPGGIVHEHSRSLTGSPAEDFFAHIHANTLFLAVKAVSLESGLMDHTIPETAVKRKMLKAAERVIVLADNTKLGKTALSTLTDLDSVDILITDEGADKKILEGLRNSGIEVIIAES